MLLATASFSLPCHASTSISGKNIKSGNSSNNTNNTSKSQKLTNTQSSQKSSTAVVATTTAALMKTIAVRANRSGAFQHDANVQKPATQINNKTNANIVNDNFKKGDSASNSIATNNRYNSKNAATSTTVNVKSTTSINAAYPSSSNSATTSKKTPILTASFLKTYAVPPTDLHRSSKARERSSSQDSLFDDLCLLKPIRTLPRTPLTGSHFLRLKSVKKPKPIKHKCSTNCDLTTVKHGADMENRREKLQPNRINESRPSSSIFQAMKPQFSAFVRLQPNLPVELQETRSGSTNQIPTKTQQKKLTTAKTQKSTKSKKVNKKKLTEINAQQNATEAGMAVITTTKTATKISSNSRKRKAQINYKQNELMDIKKPRKTKNNTKATNRQTPPLTRARKRLEGDATLAGPLVTFKKRTSKK